MDSDSGSYRKEVIWSTPGSQITGIYQSQHHGLWLGSGDLFRETDEGIRKIDSPDAGEERGKSYLYEYLDDRQGGMLLLLDSGGLYRSLPKQNTSAAARPVLVAVALTVT
jgi:hypothetical protein